MKEQQGKEGQGDERVEGKEGVKKMDGRKLKPPFKQIKSKEGNLRNM